jgi:hypothetical protein
MINSSFAMKYSALGKPASYKVKLTKPVAGRTITKGQ